MPTYYKRYKRRRFRKRAPRRYKKSKLPFSKRQSYAIKKLAVKEVNKSRELKCKVATVDEFQQFSATSNVVTVSGTANNYIFNAMDRGTARSQRTGSQISPHRFVLQGWMKVNGSSANQSYNEFKVRVILAYMDNNQIDELQTSLANSPIFWNTAPAIPTGDYRDILRNLNYKFLTPLMDRTYTVAPSRNTTDIGDGVTTTTQATGLKDHFNIKFNRILGRNKEIRWDNTANDMWQKKNIVMLSFIRTMNDDTVLNTNAFEYNLESQYYYFDA